MATVEALASSDYEQEESRALLGRHGDRHHETGTRLRVGKIRSGTIKYLGHHRKWSSYIKLALTVSGFVCLFALPAFSATLNWAVFGEQTREVDGRDVDMCGPNMLGFKINSGSPEVPKLETMTAAMIHAGRKPDAWCGVLQARIFDYWPGVVVAVFFQASSSTGTTVKSCFNGIVGTCLACFNIFVLTQVYNQGAKSDNYEEWVCWLDVVIITMAYLYLNTLSESITRMGLLFHLSMMMDFMNPATGVSLGQWSVGIPGIILHWDDGVVLNVLTAIIGSVISILPTLVGRKRLNINYAEEDATTIVKGLDTVWHESIEYFAGCKVTGKKNRIEKKTSLLQEGISRIQGDLKDAWWETFGIGRRADVRDLYTFFASTAQQLNDELYCILTSIRGMKFSDRHIQFAKDIHAPLQELEEKAVGLLAQCAVWCSDGVVSIDEQAEIERSVAKLNAVQHELVECLDGAVSTEELLSRDLGSAATLIYAISASARRVAEFAHLLPEAVEKESFCRSMYDIFANKILRIFDPKVVFDREHLLIATSNFIPIMLSFVMGYYLDDSVFTPFNASMAVNLALLFKFERVATFHLNLQRLLGVTLGLVLPKLIMAFVQMWSCEDAMRTVTQASMVFVYFFIFAYGSYTSPQWSFVFTIIGGSGGTLLDECRDEKFYIEYSSGYRSIAMVTIAVFLRMITDSMILQKVPRDFAAEEMRTLLKELRHAIAAFMRGDLAEAEACNTRAKASLETCEGLAPKADPKLKIVTGWRTAFKIDLYNDSLVQLRGIASDIEIMLLAACDWEPLAGVNHVASVKVDKMSRLDGILLSTPCYRTMGEKLDKSLRLASEALIVILEHDKEAPLQHECLKRLENETLEAPVGGDTVYQELRQKLSFETPSNAKKHITSDKRARLSVIVSATQSAAQHCAELDALCLSEYIY